MRRRYVQKLLARELKDLEKDLVKAFKSGNDTQIIRILNQFAEKLKEYQEYKDSQ